MTRPELSGGHDLCYPHAEFCRSRIWIASLPSSTAKIPATDNSVGVRARTRDVRLTRRPLPQVVVVPKILHRSTDQVRFRHHSWLQEDKGGKLLSAPRSRGSMLLFASPQWLVAGISDTIGIVDPVCAPQPLEHLMKKIDIPTTLPLLLLWQSRQTATFTAEEEKALGFRLAVGGYCTLLLSDHEKSQFLPFSNPLHHSRHIA